MSIPREQPASGPIVPKRGSGGVNGYTVPEGPPNPPTPAQVDYTFLNGGLPTGLYQFSLLTAGGTVANDFYFNMPYGLMLGGGSGFELSNADISDLSASFVGWVNGLAIGVTANDIGGGAGSMLTDGTGAAATIEVTGAVGVGWTGAPNPAQGVDETPGTPPSGANVEVELIAAVAGKIQKPLSLVYVTPPNDGSNVQLDSGVQIAVKKAGVYTNIYTIPDPVALAQAGFPVLAASPEIEGASIVAVLTNATPDYGACTIFMTAAELDA
jgi:hypothetical protein